MASRVAIDGTSSSGVALGAARAAVATNGSGSGRGRVGWRAMPRPFASLYTHGFARVAAAVPHLRPAEPAFNAERTLALARRASEERAALIAFPELGISAYAIDDLFHQEALTDAVVDALGQLTEASRELRPVLLVGAPLRLE